MCGLFGYVGSEPPDLEILSECVALAATRGPHSHGMAWVGADGRIDALRGDGPAPPEVVDALSGDARVIVGHSRLATTGTYAGGAPKIEDTMPFVGRAATQPKHLCHSDGITTEAPQPRYAREVAVVHNGNVRRYRDLASRYGVPLTTGCDSEIIAHLCARLENLRDALATTIKVVDEGRPFAIIALSNDGSLAAAHRDLPLWLAEDDRGLYLCSRKLSTIDASPAPFFLHYKTATKEIAA
jgi:glucosamine 6-phosphate synthetase-like amidotransferase/phosphosugar isomerase protein